MGNVYIGALNYFDSHRKRRCERERERERGRERERERKGGEWSGVNNRPANFIDNLCVSNSEIEMRII